MKIYSWNVNGIRAIKRKGFLDWMVEEQPDIIGLQETKIQDEQISDDLRDIEGYKSYFSFAERKGYSGVALYTKKEPISVRHGLGIERFDKEGRVLMAEYPEFTLLNVYFPNGKRNKTRLKYKLDFYDDILDFCEGLRKKGQELIIFGDYNTAHHEIDLKNPKANEDTSGFLPIEREWFDKLLKYGYLDTYRYFYPDKVEYSWWSYRTRARERNAGWRIDYHFVSEGLAEKIKDAEIMTDVMGSDHCPVTLELELS
ncbi:exodeoxyribonuclease III [Halocella sp. SP3-1]|uniref:exodeoxyribonuclease III n=1 Tax=Halocella sp. SP3-1 TaxID=2382161 RepID=UPI000F753B05|nr:exodeoxyribonuclease III [Halocella sp. SP3-1]AZO94446.1 exodeoxyribonuclease III [Halocella sp. SP3-1]